MGRAIAQVVSVQVWGTWGRRFESGLPDRSIMKAYQKARCTGRNSETKKIPAGIFFFEAPLRQSHPQPAFTRSLPDLQVQSVDISHSCFSIFPERTSRVGCHQSCIRVERLLDVSCLSVCFIGLSPKKPSLIQVFN